jgi:hypothetical protein
MNQARRNLLLSTLFGAGCVGLRALATGLPASFLLGPRRALASGTCPPGASPQFVILSTAANGDPINANAPGTYGVPGIYHCQVPGMEPAAVTLGTQSYTAARPWAAANLPADRTSVWHMMTNTPVHPKEQDVLALMGAINPAEMFPSFLSKNLAPCLHTIQSQPVCIGAGNLAEGLTYEGAPLPIIHPLSLQATLADPKGPLTDLMPLRDATLSGLYDLYRNGATPAQRRFIDEMVTSEAQARHISQSLLDALGSIKDNGIESQIVAAIVLIQMRVSPVVAIRIDFGGDNHHDTGLADEGAQTISGMAALGKLIAKLASAKLADAVSVVSLNVFGRTLGPNSTDGRDHNPNHQLSFAIGKPFRGGVYGGVGPLTAQYGGDFGALPIDSKTGLGTSTGDIAPIDTLASFGMTVATAVGVDPAVVSQQISDQFSPSGAGSAKVIAAALAP